MKVNISRSHVRDSNDKYYLMNIHEFEKVVDQSDFECRKSQMIKPFYHEHWFSTSGSSFHDFEPPVVFIRKGMVLFINGRHRTALLSNYLEYLPVVVLALDASPLTTKIDLERNREVFEHIIVRELDDNETFDFPDLPIKYLGYDPSIGK